MQNKTILGVHPALRDDIGDLVTRRPLPGPFVINSVAEIGQAIADYRAGLFGDAPL